MESLGNNTSLVSPCKWRFFIIFFSEVSNLLLVFSEVGNLVVFGRSVLQRSKYKDFALPPYRLLVQITKPLKLLEEWPEAFNMDKSLRFPMPCFGISLKKNRAEVMPKIQNGNKVKKKNSQQTSSLEKAARAGSCAKFLIRQHRGLSR